MRQFVCVVLLLGCSVDHTGLLPTGFSPGDAGPTPDVGDMDAGPVPDSGPPAECNENDRRACGPTAIGECRPGQETCQGGQWSACRGGIGPGEEVCDEERRDENCDGNANEICDCMPGDEEPCGTDEGACSIGVIGCGPDGRWGVCSEPTTTGEEVCDGIDQDCDGLVDEMVLTTFYRDADGDGYGVGADVRSACTLPEGFATTAGDCRDDEVAVYPGAAELCNGQDDNCNSVIDEGLDPLTYYVDGDRDGVGAGSPIVFCADPGEEFSLVNGDCDDTEAAVVPGGMEVCDGLDNDCSGGFDEGNVCACPGVNFRGHNYLLCVRDRNWTGSRGDCPNQADGGYRLVIINDADEQMFLTTETQAIDPALRWWIGLSDRADEDEFVWVDGTPQRNGDTILGYDNFSAGEPNSDGVEDCVEMWNGGGEWNDRNCGDGASFICESIDR